MNSEYFSLRSLGWNALFVLLANFVSSAAVLVQFLMITDLYLKPAAGVFALQVAFLTPLFLAASFQQRRILATSDGERSYGVYAHAYGFAIAHAAALGLVLAIYLLTGQSSLLSLALPISFLRILENGTEACYGFFQQRDRYSLLAVSRLIHAMLLIGSMGLFGYGLHWQLCYVLAASVVVRLATSILLDFRWAWRLQSAWRLLECTRPESHRQPEGHAGLIKFGLQLGASGCLASLIGNTPQYVLAWMGLVELIPAHVILSRAAVLGANLTRAVNEAFARPLTVGMIQRNRLQLFRLARLALGIDLAIGLSIMIACQLAYSQVDELLGVSSSGATRLDLTIVFTSMIINNLTGLSFVFLSVARSSRIMLALQTLSLTLVVGISFGLISTWGLTGSLAAIGLGKLPSLIIVGIWIIKTFNSLEAQTDRDRHQVATRSAAAA